MCCIQILRCRVGQIRICFSCFSKILKNKKNIFGKFTIVFQHNWFLVYCESKFGKFESLIYTLDQSSINPIFYPLSRINVQTNWLGPRLVSARWTMSCTSNGCLISIVGSSFCGSYLNKQSFTICRFDPVP